VDRRVVVTGLGVISAAGVGWESFWEALLAGRSQAGPIGSFSTDGFPANVACEVRNFRPKDYVANRKSLKVMARDIQLAVSAATLLVRDAGIDTKSLPSERFGVNIGAGLISAELQELAGAIMSATTDGEFSLKKWGKEGMNQLFPLWLLKYLPNMLACHISIAYDAQGPNNTHTTGDAAAIHAIGESFRIIQRDEADVMIAGGADSKIHPLAMLRYHLLGELARPKQPVSTTYHSFDRERDGFVVGEGAALVLLEELNHAKKRGAKIYAELLGFGASQDAYHPHKIHPEGRGIEEGMRRALEDAGISAGEVGHIQAHGLGTRRADVAESRAIRNLFGESAGVRVSAVKPVVGHISAASGAFGLVAAALSLSKGVLPPLANYATPDEECPLEFVLEKPIELRRAMAMVCSFGFGGQAGSLVLGKVD